MLGAVYTGQWLDGARHGQGEMKYATGDCYKGAYKAGQRHGPGMMAYKDGGVYHGGYVDGKRDGAGKIKYATGDVYDGGWKQGVRDGRGVYRKASGEVYSGRYLLNKRHGKGKLTYPGGDEYDGEHASGASQPVVLVIDFGVGTMICMSHHCLCVRVAAGSTRRVVVSQGIGRTAGGTGTACTSMRTTARSSTAAAMLWRWRGSKSS